MLEKKQSVCQREYHFFSLIISMLSAQTIYLWLNFLALRGFVTKNVVKIYHLVDCRFAYF